MHVTWLRRKKRIRFRETLNSGAVKNDIGTLTDTGPDGTVEAIDLDDLLHPPGRGIQEKCENPGYRRKGSKRELAQGILGRSKENWNLGRAEVGPRYSDASGRSRNEDSVDPQGGEPPMKRKLYKLCLRGTRAR